jgi:hypothetical protein
MGEKKRPVIGEDYIQITSNVLTNGIRFMRWFREYGKLSSGRLVLKEETDKVEEEMKTIPLVGSLW